MGERAEDKEPACGGLQVPSQRKDKIRRHRRHDREAERHCNSDELLAVRDESERQLTRSTEGMTAYRHDRAARELRKLAKELPDDCVWRYGNPAMKPYRERIDEVVLKVLVSDMKVYDKYWEFDELLDKKRKELAGIMGKYYKEKLKVDDNYMNSPLGGGNVKLKEIKTIERLQWDYHRRLATLCSGAIFYFPNAG